MRSKGTSDVKFLVVSGNWFWKCLLRPVMEESGVLVCYGRSVEKWVVLPDVHERPPQGASRIV